MTKQEAFDLMREAVGECELHASYSLRRREFDTTRFTLRAVLMGVRERLNLPPEVTHASR